jgi:hypothetical protein
MIEGFCATKTLRHSFSSSVQPAFFPRGIGLTTLIFPCEVAMQRKPLEGERRLFLDALTGVAYEDDSHSDTGNQRGNDKARPRIEIAIKPCA